MRDLDGKEPGPGARPPLRCMVRNCNTELSDGTTVRIGEKVFCKRCSVAYLKGALGL